MRSINNTLEKLRQMRARGVSDLCGKLAQQKQLCQRYVRNIEALTSLRESSQQFTLPSAVQMCNQSDYKRSIQRVIDWQKQEQVMADKQAVELQHHLLKAACREKTVELVLAERKSALALEQVRKEQNMTDSLSLQSWLRHRKAIS